MGCNESTLRHTPAPADAATAAATTTTTMTTIAVTAATAAAPSPHAAAPSVARVDAASPVVAKHTSSVATAWPARPPVPTTSWYAVAYTAPSHTPISAFHASHKGRVVLATSCIPVDADELAALPQQRPAGVCSSDSSDSAPVELGRDMLYGMAYLHNTALFTEHQWRRRVAHLLRYKAAAAAATATLASASNNDHKSNTATPAVGPAAAMARDEASVYQQPLVDLLLGVKVFVDDVLVPDRCPHPRSLPQCTTTLDAYDATAHWVCVPLVLVGHLQHVTLDTIALYRGLSLSFVEYVLEHLPPTLATTTAVTAATTRSGNGRRSQRAGADDGSELDKKSDGNDDGDDAHATMSLRVEVVYGCRAEAHFCSDFVARGGATLRLTRRTRPLLRVYAARLRERIAAADPHGSQVVRRAPAQRSTSVGTPRKNNNNNNNNKNKADDVAAQRVCAFCAQPMRFVCTMCGADVCGRRTCARRPLPGYPRGCSYHAVLHAGSTGR